MSFDRLSDRTDRVAKGIGAFGYLNVASDDDGRPTGYEIRFQMRPPGLLWVHHRFGYQRRLRDLDAVDTFLDAIEQAANGRRARLDAGETDALDEVLALADGFGR